jgi:hypothetical protein
MRNAISFSVFFHAVVFVIGYFGLPYLQPTPILTDTPIMVELVDLAEKTNAPNPSPKIDKVTKVHKDKQLIEPPLPQKSRVLPSPPESKEILSVSLEPKPKAKSKAKPLLKPKPSNKKSKQVRTLAKVKPRRKPKPPVSFESILKTVEELKTKSIQKDKKNDKKKDKIKDKSFEQQMAQALMSKKTIENPHRKLAISEIDLVRQQIRECWSLPAGAREAENLSIEIKMAMNSDGTVRQARIIDQGRLQSDPFFRAAAESALRAVLNPRCNPLKLPSEKFKHWQNMVLIFDPQKMF